MCGRCGVLFGLLFGFALGGGSCDGILAGLDLLMVHFDGGIRFCLFACLLGCLFHCFLFVCLFSAGLVLRRSHETFFLAVSPKRLSDGIATPQEFSSRCIQLHGPARSVDLPLGFGKGLAGFGSGPRIAWVSDREILARSSLSWAYDGI